MNKKVVVVTVFLGIIGIGIGIAIAIAIAIALILPPVLKKMNVVPVSIIMRSVAGLVVGSTEINAGNLFEDETPSSKIRVAVLDDHGDIAVTPKITAESVAKGVKFFISSHPSNCALTIKDQFKTDSAGLLIVVGSTTDKLTQIDDGILRIVADVTLEQREIARYVKSGSAKKILVVQDIDNLPYTEPALREFTAGLGEGYNISLCKISGKEFRPNDAQEFLSQDADMLYILVGGYQPTIGTVAQLFHLKHPELPILVTPWSRSHQILENAGPAAEKIILPSQYPSRHTDKAIRDYIDRFNDRFGYDPIAVSFGIAQSLELLDSAFKAGKRTPQEVKLYLITHSPHTTSLGIVSFDQYGDATSDFTFITDFRREFTK